MFSGAIPDDPRCAYVAACLPAPLTGGVVPARGTGAGAPARRPGLDDGLVLIQQLPGPTPPATA
ncbi:hypothetical protein Nm8I071_34130 [Nonomuraea sp. TT08I-71]|nr:hypothetical protein Nm8I071_34130 [Nonomuraea sp. TT08I-71]